MIQRKVFHFLLEFLYLDVEIQTNSFDFLELIVQSKQEILLLEQKRFSNIRFTCCSRLDNFLRAANIHSSVVVK